MINTTSDAVEIAATDLLEAVSRCDLADVDFATPTQPRRPGAAKIVLGIATACLAGWLATKSPWTSQDEHHLEAVGRASPASQLISQTTAAYQLDDPTQSTILTNDVRPALPVAPDQIVRIVEEASESLGWDLSGPLEFVGSGHPPAGEPNPDPDVSLTEARIQLGASDGELLIAVVVRPDGAPPIDLTSRGEPITIQETVWIFEGTDGNDAVSVELYDENRTIYVRSHLTTDPKSIDDLEQLAVMINNHFTD